MLLWEQKLYYLVPFLYIYVCMMFLSSRFDGIQPYSNTPHGFLWNHIILSTNVISGISVFVPQLHIHPNLTHSYISHSDDTYELQLIQ